MVVVGAGGAGAAVAYALLGLDAGQVRLVDRDRDRAEELAAKLAEHFGAGRVVAADDLERSLDDADGLVHATPTGMGGGERQRGRPRAAATRACGWPRWSTCRWTPSCCATPATPAAPPWTAAGWWPPRRPGSLELFTGVAPDRERMAAHMADLVAGQREAAR